MRTEHPQIRRSDINSHEALLETACDWLRISKGRARNYSKLLSELGQGNMSSHHTLSVNESHEITELYELWSDQVHNFPGLKEKLEEVCRSGPVLTEQENPSNSGNQSRNDAFTMLLAGRMLAAGVNVLAVENIPRTGTTCDIDTDIRCSIEQSTIDVQCKRPQSETAIRTRIGEALHQLQRSFAKGHIGCMAVDCSPFIRGRYMVIETQTLESSAELVERELTRIAHSEPKTYFANRMVGGIFFAANVPTMTRSGSSIILGANSKPFTYFNTDCVRTMVLDINGTSPAGRLVQSIGIELLRHARTNWKRGTLN